METLKGLKRTHKCATLSKENIGQEVVLMGWADQVRNLGGLIFINLRDISGIIQLYFNTDNKDLYEKAATVRGEYVLAAKGIVRMRESINPNMPTGEIEIEVNEL